MPPRMPPRPGKSRRPSLSTSDGSTSGRRHRPGCGDPIAGRFPRAPVGRNPAPGNSPPEPRHVDLIVIDRPALAVILAVAVIVGEGPFDPRHQIGLTIDGNGRALAALHDIAHGLVEEIRPVGGDDTGIAGAQAHGHHQGGKEFLHGFPPFILHEGGPIAPRGINNRRRPHSHWQGRVRGRPGSFRRHSRHGASR